MKTEKAAENERIEKERVRQNQLRLQAEERLRIASENERINQENLWLQTEQHNEKRRKKVRKLVILLFIAAASILLSYFLVIPFAKSIYAETLISDGNFEEAVNIYKSLPDYMASDEKYVSTYMKYDYIKLLKS